MNRHMIMTTICNKLKNENTLTNCVLILLLLKLQVHDGRILTRSQRVMSALHDDTVR